MSWIIYKGPDGRRAWWDRNLRLWTTQIVDADENQLGEVEYTPDQKLAMRWLKTGVWKKEAQ